MTHGEVGLARHAYTTFAGIKRGRKHKSAVGIEPHLGRVFESDFKLSASWHSQAYLLGHVGRVVAYALIALTGKKYLRRAQSGVGERHGSPRGGREHGFGLAGAYVLDGKRRCGLM